MNYKMKKYTIKKDRHYSGINFGWLRHRTLIFEFMFDETCLYSFNKNNGWNKLMGFKKGLFGIHRNSVRIGWRCDNGVIKIGSYCYIDGERKTAIICETKINTIYRCAIAETDLTYVIQVLDHKRLNKEIIIDKPLSFTILRFLSYFYFGGIKPAPHKMKVFINRDI